jgi:acetyl esterase
MAFMSPKLIASALAAVAACAAQPLPELRTEAVNAGSVFHVKNTASQPLTAYLIELVGYPGSSYTLFQDDPTSPVAPGAEKRIPVANMIVGAAPEYVKITAALYADRSTAGAPEKVALVVANRKAALETMREAIQRLEKARQAGTAKERAAAGLKQWADSLHPEGRIRHMTEASVSREAAWGVASYAAEYLGEHSIDETLAQLRAAEGRFAPAEPAAGGAIDRQGVEFAHPGGKALLLDLHIPAGAGPFPAAILIHGGGFDQGSRSTNVRPLFEPLANAGFAWFSIDYRLAPEAHAPDAVADVRSAITWVKAHAAGYRIDPRKIALIGESAGGYLVNFAGTHETPETTVAAVVDFYGPTDYGSLAQRRRDHPEEFNMASLNRHAANGGGIHFFGAEQLDAAGLAKLREFSPIAGVHKGMPPFLCIHGTKDDQVSYDQSTAMCAAMHKVGAACELITIEGGGHGMSGWRDSAMQHWKPDMIDWLQRTLAAK